jgi:hypothetical protein
MDHLLDEQPSGRGSAEFLDLYASAGPLLVDRKTGRVALCANIRSSADPDGISAQIDLIGVLGPMIGGKPSAAPNGGDARFYFPEGGHLMEKRAERWRWGEVRRIRLIGASGPVARLHGATGFRR